MLLNGRVLLPKYSPPLYIFPSPDTPTEYHFWSLQFLSMTLLQPVAGVADLNHETLDPAQWVQKRIGMPNIRVSPADTPHLPGIRALFDSCERHPPPTVRLHPGEPVNSRVFLSSKQVPRVRCYRGRWSLQSGHPGSDT